MNPADLALIARITERATERDEAASVFVSVTDPAGQTLRHPVLDGESSSYEIGGYTIRVEVGEQAPVVAWQDASA